MYVDDCLLFAKAGWMNTNLWLNGYIFFGINMEEFVQIDGVVSPSKIEEGGI